MTRSAKPPVLLSHSALPSRPNSENRPRLISLNAFIGCWWNCSSHAFFPCRLDIPQPNRRATSPAFSQVFVQSVLKIKPHPAFLSPTDRIKSRNMQVKIRQRLQTARRCRRNQACRSGEADSGLVGEIDAALDVCL